jgi:nitroreductase
MAGAPTVSATCAGGSAMFGSEEVLSFGEGVASPIDEIIANRFSCRKFSGRSVSQQTVEQILRIARFAPSGANIQPWHVYVLAGEAKDIVVAALLKAHAAKEEHVSEYRYYATDLPSPYLKRRDEFGRLFYGSLGIARDDVESRARQTARNYEFFGAPVGLIVTIDRRLEIGSWLDLGMFLQNVMLAAAGRGLQSCPQETFAKYHGLIRPLLSIPEEQMVVCGISMGFAHEAPKQRLMPRAEVQEFASFAGFDGFECSSNS